MKDMTTLLKEISEEFRHHKYWSRRDFAMTQWILGLAVFASCLGTVLVSVESVPKWLAAVIAVLPALSLMIDKTFRYRERALWHDRYMVGLTIFRYELEFTGSTAENVARRLCQFQSEMLERWPTENTAAIPNHGGNGAISPSPAVLPPSVQPPTNP